MSERLDLEYHQRVIVTFLTPGQWCRGQLLGEGTAFLVIRDEDSGKQRIIPWTAVQSVEVD